MSGPVTWPCTPRLAASGPNSTMRADFVIDREDQQLLLENVRHRDREFVITDRLTGIRWRLRTAACVLPGCYCDAIVLGREEE